LLQLAAGRHPGPSALRAADNNSAHTTKQPDPSLSRSRLNRDGLKAGAAAPEFQLPRIDGGELSLADLTGERTLLVFSDPDCGPCDDLAPQLQAVHLQRSDLQVLMVSRRDIDATRAKADKLGLTFPIVMQKQWELSLKYGMFATPIGYLIDEQGVLVSDVAVGVEPILSLTSRSAISSAQEETPARLQEEHAVAR
jgi:peroxiredoxin